MGNLYFSFPEPYHWLPIPVPVSGPQFVFLGPSPKFVFPGSGTKFVFSNSWVVLAFHSCFFFKVFNLLLGAITTTIYNYKNFCFCEIVWIDNCHSTIQATWLPTTATGKGHREKKILIKKKISNSRKIYPNREKKKKKKSIERSLCKSREQYLL